MKLSPFGRRSVLMILAAVLALVLAVTVQPALAASGDPALPDYTARVNDFTGTLSSAQTQAIESYLAGLEERTGAQGAVALVPTTAPLEPVEYKVKLFDKWKPGQKGKDNGFLVLVAMQERRVEVATGYGLEGVLPDAKVGRILDRSVMPRFKQGDIGGGLLAGVEAIGAEIEKDAGLTPSGSPADTTGGGFNPLWLLALPVVILGGLFTLLIMAALGMFRPRCPACGARMLVTDRVLRHASLVEEGAGLKVRRCPRCGHEDQREYVIHRQAPIIAVPNPRRGGRGGWGGMGGGGSGGWGGFGGGNTGGGGAGRGW